MVTKISMCLLEIAEVGIGVFTMCPLFCLILAKLENTLQIFIKFSGIKIYEDPFSNP
jgi:hypothetical protein